MATDISGHRGNHLEKMPFSHQLVQKQYAGRELAGHQTSIESWGTGRAVALIPRV